MQCSMSLILGVVKAGYYQQLYCANTKAADALAPHIQGHQANQKNSLVSGTP